MTNVTGTLLYTALLTPDNLDPTSVGSTSPNTLFAPLCANDIIYGGLGNDSIHGGAGDDAISGAEAPVTGYTVSYADDKAQTGAKIANPVESDYSHPYNPGNALGFSPTLTFQAQYDPTDPLRKIPLTSSGTLAKTSAGGLNWFLNFNSTEGPLDTYWAPAAGFTAVATDGNDDIFGDLGNDWVVGGTGRDTLWGGWGNDLLNADDDLNTGGSATNVGTDTNPSYEDLAYGGAGLDVLIGNTGGDRLIDWSASSTATSSRSRRSAWPRSARDIAPGLQELLVALAQERRRRSVPRRALRRATRRGTASRSASSAWSRSRTRPGATSTAARAIRSPATRTASATSLRTSGVIPIGSGVDHTPSYAPPMPVAVMLAALATLDPQLSGPAYVRYATRGSVTFTVRGPIGATVTLTVSDGVHSVTQTAIVTGTGFSASILVTVDTTGLADGQLTVTVHEIDINGNTEDADPLAIVKDTIAPNAPGIQLDAASDTGFSSSDWITSLATPSLHAHG